MINVKFTDSTNLNLSNPATGIPTEHILQRDYLRRLFESIYHYAPNIRFDVRTAIADGSLDIEIKASL